MVFNKIKENPIMKKYLENDEDVEVLETWMGTAIYQ